MLFSRKTLSIFALSLCCTACCSGAAKAAGFYIQEQSVSGLGSAFSGSTTNINDPSTVYFNPAGMTKLQGSQAQFGTHVIIPSAELTDTGSTGLSATNTGDGGNPYDPTPVPNAFVTHQINDRIWAGLSLSAPFGLANEYDNGWFGRFDSTETELLTLDIQPSVAFKVNEMLSVGAGVNIQYADAELKSATGGAGPLSEGTSTLEGDDLSYGYTLGLQFKPIETTTFGASYRSAISHTLDGRIKSEGTTLNDFNVRGSADLDLPDIATFGLAHDMNDKLTLQAQATWFGWNNFQDITAITDESIAGAVTTASPGGAVSSIIQNYQTTWAYAIGAEYDYSDDWTLRAGMQFDATPTTDQFRTSRTPDGDRTWLSGGATYSLNEKIDIDMAATYIWIADEEINVTRNNSTATVRADTEGSVGIVAVGLTYKF